MVAWNMILFIIGILALLDSLVVFLFPSWTVRTTKKWFRDKKDKKKINKKALSKWAWIELIIALILILMGMNI